MQRDNCGILTNGWYDMPDRDSRAVVHGFEVPGRQSHHKSESVGRVQRKMKFSAGACVEFRHDLDWRERALRQDEDVNVQLPYKSGDLVKWLARARVPEQDVQLNTLSAVDCPSRRVE